MKYSRPFAIGDSPEDINSGTAASIDPRNVTTSSAGPSSSAPLDPFSVPASTVDPRSMDTVTECGSIPASAETTSQGRFCEGLEK